jgi:Asp-tRNA(Asn)/Glu-tRNA(Gln) amidotransferase A subunit family amidase
VDSTLDKQVSTFKARNTIEAGAYTMYDSTSMHGLPVGVQVICKRLEEEKVLEGMKVIDRLLRQDGIGYELLST